MTIIAAAGFALGLLSAVVGIRHQHAGLAAMMPASPPTGRTMIVSRATWARLSEGRVNVGRCERCSP